MVNEKNPPDKNDQEDLIIYHPEALNPFRKGIELTVTSIGWLIWGVLCRPLMLTFMWFLGFEIFYEHMIRLRGLIALVDFIFIYLAVIFFMYLFIRGWNYYNSRRFKGKDRRKSVKEVSPQDLESYFKFTAHTVEKAQGWKNITIIFQENNQIFLEEDLNSNIKNQYKGYFKPG